MLCREHLHLILLHTLIKTQQWEIIKTDILQYFQQAKISLVFCRKSMMFSLQNQQ